MINIYNLVKILNKTLYFNPNLIKSEDIIDSIIDSRFYVEYIDNKNKNRISNNRYLRYLDYKYIMYLKYVIKEDIPDYSQEKYSEKYYRKIDEIYNKYFVNKRNLDDYTLIDDDLINKKIYLTIDMDNEKIIIDDSELYEDYPKINTIEESLFVLGLDYIEKLIETDIHHLTEKFKVENQYFTILLPSILIKNNEEYLDNIIFMNIYDSGMINIKLMISDKREKLLSNDNINMLDEIYSKIEIPKKILKYKDVDFFDKYIMYDKSIVDIMNEYSEIILNILNWSSIKEDNRMIQPEYTLLKEEELTNKEMGIFLLGANKKYINGLKDKDLKDIEKKYLILDRKYYNAYSTNISLLQNIEKKALGLSNEEFQQTDISKTLILNSIENNRIYEIVLIKKYFYLLLLDQLKNINTQNFDVDAFESLKSLREKFELSYNENFIFQEKTTYRKVYKSMYNNMFLEIDFKTKVINEEERIEKILKKKKAEQIQSKETGNQWITIITTVLTTILSMNNMPKIIKIIGEGLESQINIEIINRFGSFLKSKNIIIAMIFTIFLILIIISINNKHFKNKEKI